MFVCHVIDIPEKCQASAVYIIDKYSVSNVLNIRILRE